MIPVTRKPEPDNFDRKVRQPGLRFLAENPQPIRWQNREYWQQALSDMRHAYDSICAYCATWIPHSTGSHSIDHFVPKSQAPWMAYEWDNYRYVSARFNNRKGTQTIVDPFELSSDWFLLDFTSFLIHPNPELSSAEKESIWQTIAILRLNDDEDLVVERQTYFTDYQENQTSFEHLQRRAPFIASELIRQGYV
ncbi:MAG: hypothetical protein DWI57_01400 [Chloroflexi bacterium]|nr:MAG: hypothetical protein DWI57_01400 [Chloroflexota bacterium]